MSVGDFFSMTLTVPSKPEQEKLWTFLAVVDERIGVGEKSLNCSKPTSAASCKKSLPSKFDLRGENGNPYPEWEEKKLEKFRLLKRARRTQILQKVMESIGFTHALDYLHTDVYLFEGEAILVAGNADNLCHYYNGKFEAYQRTYVLQNFKTDGKYLYKYLFTSLGSTHWG